MRQKLAAWAAGLTALACTGSLQAHHSGYMYQTTPIWIKGAVVGFENKNPHSITMLEDRGQDGQVLRWAVEGPGQAQLGRMGIGIPKTGDVIEVCAFPYKPPEELSRIGLGVDTSARQSPPAADGPSPQFVAGHVLTMPDGEKRFWEPHGIISECIRSRDDQRQSWLDFLNSNPRARQAWCEQRGYAHVRSTAPLSEFVAEIDRLIDDPC